MNHFQLSFSKLQKALKVNKFDFQCSQQKQNNTWKKTNVHFPRRTQITEKENQIVNTKQSNDNPTKTFNDSKNTKQTKESLNTNEKFPLETQIN